MVKATLLLLTIAAVSAGPPGPAVMGDGGDDATTMKLVVPQKWEYLLPGESPLAFGTGTDGQRILPIPHQGGAGFVVDPTPTALAVDTNGDGKVDEKVKGVGGSVTLKGRGQDGAPFSYAVRIVKSGAEWRYMSGCAMSGKLLGEDVKIVDLNGNGRYDDYGVDAMIIGSGMAASYLSKAVSIGGKVYSVTVSATGDSIKATPFEGELGTVSLVAGFKSDGGTLAAAVVSSASGDVSFELSNARSGLIVPAGEYKLMHGAARKGGESVKIRGGASKPIFVPANKTATMEWGGPIAMDFEYSIVKDRIHVPPNVKYFGAGGEEYYEFKPDAKSPKIIITDKESKKVVQEGRFGGC